MNIFLDKDITTLNEKFFLVSMVKKFYTGKDEDEIEDFKEKIKNAKTKEELKEIVEDIKESIETLESFRTRFLSPDFASSLNAAFQKGAIPAAIIRNHYMEGKGKVAMENHYRELKKVLSLANSQFSKIRK